MMDRQIVEFLSNQELGDFFRTYDDAERLIRLTDEAPGWLHDLSDSVSREIGGNHNIFLDWLADVLGLIADSDGAHLEDATADWSPMIYNADLLWWVGSDPTHSSYVNDALDEYETKDFYTAIQQGQYLMLRDIAYRTVEWLRENFEDIREGEEEDE